jgi:hypothetical protein
MFYPGFFSEISLAKFFTDVKSVFSCSFYIVFYGLSSGFGYVVQGLFGNVGLIYFNSSFANVNQALLGHLIFLWFSFPALPVTNSSGTVIATYYVTSFNDVGNYFYYTLLDLANNIYALAFIIFGIIAIANALLFLFQMKAKYSLNAVMSMAGMVILPLTLTAFQNFLSFFGMSWNILSNLPVALRPVITQALSEGWNYFTNPVFYAALFIYLFLELSYQVEYADLVTKPSEEREERLRYQLNALQREGSRVTTTIEKIQAKVKEKRKEEGFQGNRLRQFFSKAGGFSYVKEMVEKRKFEKSTQRWLEAASDTRRLGSYVQRLMTEDPEARRTLTAKSSAPTSGKMITSTILNVTIRAAVVVFLTFIVIQPVFILNALFTGFGTLSPPIENYAILQSAEIHTPEAILTLLIPIVSIFPVSSIIIKRVKQQRLKELLIQEQKRREEAEQAIFATKLSTSGASPTSPPSPPESTAK